MVFEGHETTGIHIYIIRRIRDNLYFWCCLGEGMSLSLSENRISFKTGDLAALAAGRHTLDVAVVMPENKRVVAKARTTFISDPKHKSEL